MAVITVFASLYLFHASSTAASGGIDWYGYDEGIALSKKSDKQIFISFYADWCSYCKVMEKETFKEPSVVAYLNKNFIPVKVNSDKEQHVASLFKVRGLPDNWFISKEGEVIGHRPGFIPPETMINMLRYIHTESYKSMSFKKFMNND
jgi:thioredoxin-related protein